MNLLQGDFFAGLKTTVQFAGISALYSHVFHWVDISQTGIKVKTQFEHLTYKSVYNSFLTMQKWKNVFKFE
jgi:hypothetical protein